MTYHVIKDYNTKKGFPLILHENKFFKMIFNGFYHYLEPIKYSKSAIIIPITKDNKIILISLQRTPIIGISFEFPRGGIEDKESYEHGILRELLEETGTIGNIKDLIFLGDIAAETSTINTTTKVFLVKNLIPFENNYDKNEIQEVHLYSIKEFEELINNGKIICSQTLASYLLLKLKNIL